MRKFCTTNLADRVTNFEGTEADVEYYDFIDNKTNWARLRLGPDNMNSRTAKDFIRDFISLEKSNPKAENSCVVGVLYGDKDSINASFRSLSDRGIPVYVGPDFWHRITGDPKFYQKLVAEIETILDNVTDSYLDDVVSNLGKELNLDPDYSGK